MNLGATAPRPSILRVGFAILGAPVAWAAEESLGWLLSSGSCPAGSPRGIGGAGIVTAPYPWLIGIAVAALIVSLSALWVAIGEWRKSRDPGITSIHAYGVSDYLGAVAVLVSFVFTLAVLMQSAAIFVLPPCQIVR